MKNSEQNVPGAIGNNPKGQILTISETKCFCILNPKNYIIFNIISIKLYYDYYSKTSSLDKRFFYY